MLSNGYQLLVRRHVMCIAAILTLPFISACGGGSMASSTLDKDIAASFEVFANRKIFTRLDPSTLSSIADAEVELAIIDYVSYKLDGHYHEEVNIVGALPTGIRATYLTWIVEAEVHNGGFNQYYFNTDGKFASEAVEAFEYFGAPEHAALMREANTVRASEEIEMAEFKKQGSSQAFSESYEHTKLGVLDDRFYKLTENLSQLCVARIRQMPEQFFGE